LETDPGMKLQEARLCLDCEELHTQEQCPVCASEAFSFLTRWIPSNEVTRDLAAAERRRADRLILREALASR
jgi:hypothetical protein